MAQRGGAEEKGTLREVEKAEKFLLFQPRKKLLNHQRFWAGWIMNLPLQWSAGWYCRDVQPCSHLAAGDKRAHLKTNNPASVQIQLTLCISLFHDCKDCAATSVPISKAAVFLQVSVIQEQQTKGCHGDTARAATGQRRGGTRAHTSKHGEKVFNILPANPAESTDRQSLN